MNGDVRRTYEMTARVVNVNDAQPDTDGGQRLSAERLKQVRVEMEQVAARQRTGLIDVHTSAVEKKRLRREMLAGPIAHLSEIGGLAGREHPDLVDRSGISHGVPLTWRTGPPPAVCRPKPRLTRRYYRSLACRKQ